MASWRALLESDTDAVLHRADHVAFRVFEHHKGAYTFDLKRDAIVIRTLGLRLPSGHQIESHAHDWHQLVYATDGVMSVHTTTGAWVVPPHRAVWLLAGFEHAIRMTGAVRMRTVYFHPGFVGDAPQECSVVNVTPLLRELILETVRRGMLKHDVPEQSRFAAVLLDQMRRTEEEPLRVRFPVDARASAVAAKAREDLSVTRSLSELASGCGASVRTIERLFVAETGMTFGRWLQRLRALHALERLAAGDSVTVAGLAVGYDSTSAFIAMFRRVIGKTPGSCFALGGSS